MGQTERINHLVSTLGEFEAKKKCLEICKVYDNELYLKKRYTTFRVQMAKAVDELLEFICS